ncbi:MAG: phosphoenolpyruvate carboxylase, partial [Chloroflexota bacterium]|nr:phosphoenolpyruvate carboxylase [Chloroflexota bacterium]
DMEHLTNCDAIVRDFLRESEQTDHQRVFLARSDPALNYGAVAAELMLKVALARLGRLEEETGVPLYPIIGVGAVPFRGHLSPVNVDRAFAEYPSAQTLTIQSAFKFDYPSDAVREAIERIMARERSAPMPIDEPRAQAIMDKAAAEHQAQVRSLAPVIAAVSPNVPKRRERKLHVGMFGYGRQLGGSGSDMTLPRAISFTASLYSIGVPPELLGLGALDADDMAYVREVYPSFDHDMASALRYANQARVAEVLGDDYARLARDFAGDVDRVHEGLTSAIWATVGRASTVNVTHYIEEAAQLRRFLG